MWLGKNFLYVICEFINRQLLYIYLHIYLTMVGLRIIVFSLFIWLSFSAPVQSIGLSSIDDSPSGISVSSSGVNHNALIVDSYFKPHHTNGSLRSFKIPYAPSNTSVQLFIAESYTHKLTYFEIGKSIPLRLTSRTIIFPFHFYT